MADIMPVPTFDEQVQTFRKMERRIGALEFQLQLVDFLQSKGYNALIIHDVLTFVPQEKE